MNAMKMKTLPTTITYFRVDEVIECLSLGAPYDWKTPEAKAKRARVEADLMATMPDAYKASADGTPEMREFPEPDAEPDRKLSLVWAKLNDESRGAIRSAVAKELREREASYRAHYPREARADLARRHERRHREAA